MDIIIALKNEKRSKVNVEMSWKISVAERKDHFWDMYMLPYRTYPCLKKLYMTRTNCSL